MTNIYVTLQKIFGIFSICLLVIGTAGNLLSFYICLRIKNNSTFTFITFLVIADLLTLYYWNLNNFLSQFTQINLLSVNLWVCKFGNFLQFTSLQCSAWILVLICWDRFFSVRFNHWKSIHFKSPRPLIAVISTVSFICLINLNILITFGYDYRTENGSIITVCHEVSHIPSTVWMDIWGKVHFGLYSLAPFVVIAISNFWLIYTIYKKKTIITSTSSTIAAKDKRLSRHDRMNATVLIMTFLFIVMTSPIAMASFFFDTLFTTDQGNFVIVLIDFISFCYHGLTFLIMTLTNKVFYNEFRKLFGVKTLEISEFNIKSRSRVT